MKLQTILMVISLVIPMESMPPNLHMNRFTDIYRSSPAPDIKSRPKDLGMPFRSILHPLLDDSFSQTKTDTEVLRHMTHPIAFFNNDLMRYGPHVLQEFERSIEYGRDTRIRMGF